MGPRNMSKLKVKQISLANTLKNHRPDAQIGYISTARSGAELSVITIGSQPKIETHLDYLIILGNVKDGGRGGDAHW